MQRSNLSAARLPLRLPAQSITCSTPPELFHRAERVRLYLLPALVCLLALCSAGPALAGDITVDDSCSLHDAIIAANTDSPVGGCPAGSGADTIKAVGQFIPWGLSGIALREPLPPITSTVIIVIQSGMPGPGNEFVIFLQSAVNPVFDVAGGGHLTLDGISIRANRIAGARGLIVRRGGRAELRRSHIDAVPAPCGGAITNEGVLTIRDSQIIRKAPVSFLGREPWTPEPGATLIHNNGGSLVRSGLQTNVGPEELVSSGPACQTSGPPAPVNRPAPACRLPPQLRVGDRAILSGSHFSNLRSEAGISGQKMVLIVVGDIVDVIEGPVEADGHNWYRVRMEVGLEGWVAEGPARGFHCAYYFMNFNGELPPRGPAVTPERQDCDEAQSPVVGDHAIIARGSHINYRAEPGLDGAQRGSLAPGSVLEVLDGPEDSDGYEWWQVRNLVRGLDGWVAGGGVVSSGQCVRWLLPLETGRDTVEAPDLDKSVAMMEEETDADAQDEATEEDSEASSS